MRTRSRTWISFACLSAMLARAAGAQQIGDSGWRPHVDPPTFTVGRGPVVYIDEAHHNFHTATGRFAPFAQLLTADGYRVRRFMSAFDSASLDSIKVLVISNALAAENDGNWTRPVRSAFTSAEMNAVETWVARGGALLLIADHMPMAGGAMLLAARFGIPYVDGFAIDSSPQWDRVTMFRRRDRSLADHPITNGRSRRERVDSIATFAGTALMPTRAVDTILVLPEGTRIMLPQVAWQFSDSTPFLLGSRMLQAAVRQYGRGHVAVFGEAAMFTAQRTSGGGPMGLNDPRAAGNQQFILNVLHWMNGLLPRRSGVR